MAKEAGAKLPLIAIVPEGMAGQPDAASIESVRDSLLQVKVSDLRAIAKVRDVKVRGSSREAIADELAGALLDPEINRRILLVTTPIGRGVLAVLLFGHGEDVVRELNLGHLQHLFSSWGVSSKDVAAAVEGLAASGLLLPVAGQERSPEPQWQPNAAIRSLVLPILPDVAAFAGVLPQAETAQPDVAMAEVLARLAAVATEVGRDRMYLLPFVRPKEYRGETVRNQKIWSIVGDLPPRNVAIRPARGEPRIGAQVVPVGLFIPNSNLAKLAEGAGISSVQEASGFLRLLMAMGLVWRDEQDFHLDIPAWRQFAALPERQRFVRLAAVLGDGGLLGELEQSLTYDRQLSMWIAPSYQYVDPQTVATDVGRLRQALLSLLAWLPVGSWYDLNSALHAVRRLYPDLPVSFNAQSLQWQDSVWWLQRAPGEATPAVGYLDRHDPRDWREGLGRLLTTILVASLSWLGLVEVVAADGSLVRAADSANLDLPAGFRLTELGGLYLSARPAGVLRLQPSSDSAGDAILHIDPRQPDQLATRNLSLDALLALSQFADPLLQTPAATTFRLSRESVARGFDAGALPDDLLYMLAPFSGAALTDLRRKLTEWWDAYGRLHIYTGVALIELGDDFVRTELAAGTRLTDYILYEFSPRLLVVRETDVDAIVAMLGRAGQAARVVDDMIGSGVA